jgi:basic membrane protein A
VGAIGVAEENDVLWFGTQADQSSLAPSIVVANQVYRWDIVLEDMLYLIADGTYGGQAFRIELANGGEEIAYNPDFTLDNDVMILAEATIAGIVDSSIVIDFGN